MACISTLFFFYCQMIFHCMNMSHFIYSCIILWTLVCFHSISIINNAATNIWYKIYMDIYLISLGHIARDDIARSYGNSIFDWRTARMFSNVTASFYIPTSSPWGFWFLYILANNYYLFIFIITILMGVECYFIVVLIYLFLMANDVELLFKYLLVICISLQNCVFRYYLIGLSFYYWGITSLKIF